MSGTGRKVTALAFVVALVGGACGGSDDGSGGGDGSGGETLQVAAQDFQFSPGELSADPGVEYTIEVTNEGEAPHTFTADDIGVDISLDPGASGEATFTAPDGGSIEWHCNIHTSMTGTITVGGSESGSGGTQPEEEADY